jgi:hypothetical protein
MHAKTILHNVGKTLDERGQQYDKDGNKDPALKEERSMDKTVEIFNRLTGQDLTVVQGWEFMSILKKVRYWQCGPDVVHVDSLIDDVAYAALKAEAATDAQETAIALATTQEYIVGASESPHAHTQRTRKAD